MIRCEVEESLPTKIALVETDVALTNRKCDFGLGLFDSDFRPIWQGPNASSAPRSKGFAKLLDTDAMAGEAVND